MPDGATHILVQIIINRFIHANKLIPYLLFGSVAPDLFKVVSRIVMPEYEWVFAERTQKVGPEWTIRRARAR